MNLTRICILLILFIFIELFNLPISIAATKIPSLEFSNLIASGLGYRGNEVINTNDGGYLLNISYQPEIYGAASVYLRKVNNKGEKQWDKFIPISKHESHVAKIIDRKSVV